MKRNTEKFLIVSGIMAYICIEGYVLYEVVIVLSQAFNPMNAF